MLTQREADCHAFIGLRIETTGIAPSFAEIMHGLGLKSTSNAYRLVCGLEEKGYLRRLIGRARSIEIVRHADGTPTENGAAAALLRALDSFFMGDIDEVELHDIWQEYRPPRKRAA